MVDLVARIVNVMIKSFFRFLIGVTVGIQVEEAIFTLPYRPNLIDAGIIIFGLLVIYFIAQTRDYRIIVFSVFSGITSLLGIIILGAMYAKSFLAFEELSFGTSEAVHIVIVLITGGIYAVLLKKGKLGT